MGRPPRKTRTKPREPKKPSYRPRDHFLGRPPSFPAVPVPDFATTSLDTVNPPAPSRVQAPVLALEPDPEPVPLAASSLRWLPLAVVLATAAGLVFGAALALV